MGRGASQESDASVVFCDKYGCCTQIIRTSHILDINGEKNLLSSKILLNILKLKLLTLINMK